MKNFLPGPSAVAPEILSVLSEPIIGHHTDEFYALMADLKPRLQRLLGTRHPVFPLTCTASAAMEAALLNSAAKKILVLANGAFGERWLNAARNLDLPADGLKFAWGVPLPEHEIGRVLDRTGCDTLVMVHGESSTGMLNPLQSVKNALERRPQVLFILDAAATLGGVPLKMDADGVDILVGASQKCLALPPGIVPVGVSEKALQRSKRAARKGYAADFTLWKERWDENQTVATPAIPQLQALNRQLVRIENEGLEERWQRHRRLSRKTLEWARGRNWVPFAPPEHCLPSISCLRPEDGRRTGPISEAMQRRGYWIDAGYGKLKDRTLRIGHMGECGEDDLDELLQTLSAVLQ